VASRADAVVRPAAPVHLASREPSLGGAIGMALTDLSSHSWRLVPANIVWAVIAILVLVALVLSPLGYVIAPILALPTAGIFRMTARIARGEDTSFWDAIRAWRTETWTELGLGAALLGAGLVFSVNIASGIVLGTMVGWALATLAFWGLAAAWLLAWSAWPVLADPRRALWPARFRLQLAALLVLAHPVRLAALGAGLAIFLVASTVAIVALITISVVVSASIATRLVLPAADRLDERLGFGESHELSLVLDDD
jgi:hypothetical protein